MSGSTHDPDSLNQASAHDTGLYDPAVHDNQIVALYETDAKARAAETMMQSAGFAASSMQVVARDGGQAATTGAVDEGLWGSIKSLFVPDQDRDTYNTAIARGHAMLVVTPDRTMDRQHLIHTLEATEPLDFDAKLEEWRQTGYDTTGSASGTSMSNAATAGHAVDAGLNTRNATPTPMTATAAPVARTSAAPTGTGTAAGATTMGLAGQPATAAPTDANTIKVMEERLRVGKREVAQGAVRIRSYIVERPIEEQVTLHEEHVGIERHPVDRAANAADFGAFEERTLEARATSEEAVVSKDARVVEEIALKKEATDRTETIRDTVRKTEVEIEGDAASKTGTLPGNTAANPNATPDATTSGTNTPRR